MMCKYFQRDFFSYYHFVVFVMNFFGLVWFGLVSFGRRVQQQVESLSDFSSDIVTRCAAALGIVAASACYWSPVFAGAK